MANVIRRCRTCHFWDYEGIEDRRDAEANHRCRRLPPAFVEGAEQGAWPYTQGFDWCGEWVDFDPHGDPVEFHDD